MRTTRGGQTEALYARVRPITKDILRSYTEEREISLARGTDELVAIGALAVAVMHGTDPVTPDRLVRDITQIMIYGHGGDHLVGSEVPCPGSHLLPVFSGEHDDPTM